MNLIDIGANLTSKQFRSDRDAVIDRALAAGVAQMVVTGTRVEASQEASRLAASRPGILYSTAGVHPHNARDCDGDTIAELRRLAAADHVVAIGECGLDYDRNFSPPAVQRDWFAAQLALAVELQMPVFLHERAAHADFVDIVRDHRRELPRAVIHCFTGQQSELEAYLDLDLHIGITGWICDERRGTHLREIAGLIPANRLMVETDAPFLLPRDLSPKPKSRRNEPAHLPHIVRRVADAVGRSEPSVAADTTATARAFFGLD
jgi:TatD DNase family protein